MAWFEAHDTLGRHPKTLRLARLLNKDRRWAVGMLHDLFAWGLSAADRDGNLPGLTKADIAAALDVQRVRPDPVQALADSGFLELHGDTYAIHDWYDYAGKLMERREVEREKLRRFRQRKTTAPDASDETVT